MKKIFIIAVLALANCVVSCSNDAPNVTPSDNLQNIHVQHDYSLMQKDGDTLGSGDTGGQTGTLPPRP